MASCSSRASPADGIRPQVVRAHLLTPRRAWWHAHWPCAHCDSPCFSYCSDRTEGLTICVSFSRARLRSYRLEAHVQRPSDAALHAEGAGSNHQSAPDNDDRTCTSALCLWLHTPHDLTAHSRPCAVQTEVQACRALTAGRHRCGAAARARGSLRISHGKVTLERLHARGEPAPEASGGRGRATTSPSGAYSSVLRRWARPVHMVRRPA